MSWLPPGTWYECLHGPSNLLAINRYGCPDAALMRCRSNARPHALPCAVGFSCEVGSVLYLINLCLPSCWFLSWRTLQDVPLAVLASSCWRSLAAVFILPHPRLSRCEMGLQSVCLHRVMAGFVCCRWRVLLGIAPTTRGSHCAVPCHYPALMINASLPSPLLCSRSPEARPGIGGCDFLRASPALCLRLPVACALHY